MSIPDWSHWLRDAAIFVLIAAWLTLSAHAFRIRKSRRWIPGGLFALGYVASVAGVALNNSLGDIYRGHADFLKNPAPPSHLDETWGKDLPPDKRHEYSEMLARVSYQSWGIHVRHFDLDGHMKVFEPTEEDRRTFQKRGAQIEEAQNVSRLLQIWTGLFLALPLLSLGLSFLIPSRKPFFTPTVSPKHEL